MTHRINPLSPHAGNTEQLSSHSGNTERLSSSAARKRRLRNLQSLFNTDDTTSNKVPRAAAPVISSMASLVPYFQTPPNFSAPQNFQTPQNFPVAQNFPAPHISNISSTSPTQNKRTELPGAPRKRPPPLNRRQVSHFIPPKPFIINANSLMQNVETALAEKVSISLGNSLWNVVEKIQHSGQYHEVFRLENAENAQDKKVLKILKKEEQLYSNGNVRSILSCELLQYAQLRNSGIKVAKFEVLDELYEDKTRDLSSYDSCEKVVENTLLERGLGGHLVSYIPHGFPEKGSVGYDKAKEKLKTLFQACHDANIPADLAKDNVRVDDQGELVIIDLHPIREDPYGALNLFDILFEKHVRTFLKEGSSEQDFQTLWQDLQPTGFTL